VAKVKVNSRPVGRPARTLDPMINWMVDVGEWMIDYLQKNNRIASGESINSFEVTAIQNPQFVELKAADSVKWALQGRKAGRFPNVGRLRQWVRDKLGETNVKTINRIAYLVGRKISLSGTSEPKLRVQNIQLVIKQKGIKHTQKLADNLAEDIAAATLQGFKRIKK